MSDQKVSDQKAVEEVARIFGIPPRMLQPRTRRVVRMPDGRVMRTNQQSSPRPRKAE